MTIILADNQDITRAGLQFVVGQMGECQCNVANDKAGVIALLKTAPDAVVIFDYTLFDINDADEMLILSDRFPKTMWILFSEDLSLDLVRRLIASSTQISVLLKESPLAEIKECVRQALLSRRFIGQRVAEMLLTAQPAEEKAILTRTETEILKDIALGMTTREISEKRFSSFHTVNTHRKNIFRKLGVNNVHEATKYALRAGLIDPAEYYI
ncbi:MAG: response regulator transcription factor [Prevotella sp.]|nr:response regulator transcription factor [Prevotella sp.]